MYLHALVFSSKQIWLDLISRLHVRGLIDLLPGQSLQELSLDVLINLAKHAAQGPVSWSTHHHSRPAITHQTVLHIPHPTLTDTFYDEAKMLPGGQFVLYTNSGRLRCWSVVDDRLVWEYQTHEDSLIVLEFSEVIDGRQANVVVISGQLMGAGYVPCFTVPEHIWKDEIGRYLWRLCSWTSR